MGGFFSLLCVFVLYSFFVCMCDVKCVCSSFVNFLLYPFFFRFALYVFVNYKEKIIF